MSLLPEPLYATIEASVPIVCVDFVLVKRRGDGSIGRLGLVRRHSPFGEVWCHLGGRVRRGDTIGQAITRHLGDALTGTAPDLPADPQPDHVYQWFPDDVAPSRGTSAHAPDLAHGRDPRKHAIGLTFALEAGGDPVVRPGGEAIEFAYHDAGALPDPLWPGCEALFARLDAAVRRRPGPA